VLGLTHYFQLSSSTGNNRRLWNHKPPGSDGPSYEVFAALYSALAANEIKQGANASPPAYRSFAPRHRTWQAFRLHLGQQDEKFGTLPA